ncbi:hypothetical protein BX661DRAFT_181441 [Kickxella alabastrina]|uniref:uncharacterized protein n=1 Tax=Kickxella alabastrina TaxID=61397 RepID=UPI00221E6D9E|nr:uncharacterized protein BX661DRAFT_181441 [Kickxella alabastrina]KAI7829142.1 hypothetical protein BX661DRAFT_181441 [Kickxella alabastrina]
MYIGKGDQISQGNAVGYKVGLANEALVDGLGENLALRGTVAGRHGHPLADLGLVRIGLASKGAVVLCSNELGDRVCALDLLAVKIQLRQLICNSGDRELLFGLGHKCQQQLECRIGVVD